METLVAQASVSRSSYWTSIFVFAHMAHRFVARSLGFPCGNPRGTPAAGPGISQGSIGGAVVRALCVHVPGSTVEDAQPGDSSVEDTQPGSPDSVIEDIQTSSVTEAAAVGCAVVNKVSANLLPPVLHPSRSPAGHPSIGRADVRALCVQVSGSTVEDAQPGNSCCGGHTAWLACFSLQ